MGAKNGNVTSPGGVSAAAEFVLSLCMGFFMLQASRDILVSPGGFEKVKYIVFVIAGAPVAAGILASIIPGWGVMAFLGAAAALAGRALLLRPAPGPYFMGEYLVFGGYAFYFVARLTQVAKRCGEGPAAAGPVAMFTAGFLCAPLLQLYLRSKDIVQNGAVIWFFIVLAGAALLAATLLPPGSRDARDTAGQGAPRRGFIAGFSILFIAIPFHYIFYWCMRPELFSGITNIDYKWPVFGVKLALLGAVAGAMEIVRDGSPARLFRDRFFSALVSLFLLGFMFSMPQGWFYLVLIVAGLSGAVTALTPLAVFFSTRPLRLRALWLGLGLTAGMLSVVWLEVYFLEHHAPWLHWRLMGALAAALLLVWIAGRGLRGPVKYSLGMKGVAFGVGTLAFALFLLGGRPAYMRDTSGAGRKVLACLYTWYGSPGKPFGEYGFEQFNGLSKDASQWSAKDSTVKNMGVSLKETGNSDCSREKVITTSKNIANESGMASLAAPVDTKVLDPNSRTYFDFKAVTGRLVSSCIKDEINIANADFFDFVKTTGFVFFIRREGVLYTADLKITQPYSPGAFRLVFPEDFQRKTGAGPDGIGFQANCAGTGVCAINAGGLKVSNWKHWNEDYHTAKIDGKWNNDPPDTLAAAHHVTYTGKPWPEIEPYSPDGWYDSWDPAVIRSQLRLMEKAGIDAVMIMHPAEADVVGNIIKIMDEIKSPLKFVYYDWYETPTTGKTIDVLRRYGSSPRWLKAGGKPVWIMGKTGLLSRPYKVYEREIPEARRATGAFIVGDQYVPPKEEMLSLLDGSYYYDTTGLYRARWGGPTIAAAQPDGTFITGYGDLLKIFRAVTKSVHYRGGLHIATVIPGFDNTHVHGFIGSPFEDGRPGTIVERHGGRTYAETWKAAINSGADWACIVSWNELHEGTGIEPTKEHGVYYVNATREWAEKFRNGKY